MIINDHQSSSIIINHHQSSSIIINDHQSSSIKEWIFTTFLIFRSLIPFLEWKCFGFSWSHAAKIFRRFLDFNGQMKPSQGSKSQDLGQIWNPKIQKKITSPQHFFFKLHINHVKPNSEVWTEKKSAKIISVWREFFFLGTTFFVLRMPWSGEKMNKKNLIFFPLGEKIFSEKSEISSASQGHL